MTTVAPLVPIPPGGYCRTFEAEIDDHSDSDLLVRGILQDHRFSLEHTWVLRTPEYEVLEAAARHLSGDPTVLSSELSLRYREVTGVRIGRGFSNRIRSVLGDLPGQREYVFLAIEMARAGQQVYKCPKDFDTQFLPRVADLPPGPSREARLAWEKDRAYMPDLPNSCYTYSDTSARLFSERAVTCTFNSSVTSPTPGQKGIFWRRKRLAISGDAREFHCHSSMQDTIHDISVDFRLSSDGVIREAHSRGLRLPYSGICEDPQLRTSGLNGKRVNRDYMRLLADQVGGSSGCTHLFDLSVDCLRLFEYS